MQRSNYNRVPARAQDRTDFRSGTLSDDHNQMYEQQRQVVERTRNNRPYRGRNKVSRGRTDYNKQRMETMRGERSMVTENDLSEDLRRKLFPGIKNGESAMERLEAVNTAKAITLCITTRSMGFGTVNVFMALSEFQNIPIRGNIYQYYRISLALLQCKVMIAQRGVTAIMDNEEDYEHFLPNEDFISTVKGVIAMPDQITLPINQIGKVKVNDKLYVPKIGKERTTRHNLFIPQSEQVTFKNLRNTVVALANNETPREYRRRFYNNNPIPGCKWGGIPDNPLLLNANDIIPDRYSLQDLTDDIMDIRGKMNYLNKKAPKYFTGVVNFSPEGTKSMLVCNEQENLKVIDRGLDESLNDYYVRLKLQGDVQNYYNIERLTVDEQIKGCIGLLGEVPTSSALEFPTYISRNKRICSEFCSLKYKATLNLRYT
jgi:hypothetical protein